jgi:hypothetical protein
MIGWLYRFLIGRFSQCDHKWETIDTVHVTDTGQDTAWYRYILKCEKCGEITSRNPRGRN